MRKMSHKKQRRKMFHRLALCAAIAVLAFSQSFILYKIYAVEEMIYSLGGFVANLLGR
jgi:hypothetical protein